MLYAMLRYIFWFQGSVLKSLTTVALTALSLLQVVVDSSTGLIADYGSEVEITEWVFIIFIYIAMAAVLVTMIDSLFSCSCEPLPDGRFFLEVMHLSQIILTISELLAQGQN